MGMQKRDHIRVMMEAPEIAAAWRRVHGRDPTGADVDALYADFIPMQLSCLADYNDLVPGAAETVRRWQAAGVKVAATTGYDEEMTRIVLAGAAAQGLTPDAAFCAAQVPQGRPAPWLIFRSMEQLGIFPPAAVAKVGDTVADIEAGRNAGVWTVGVVETGNMMGLSRRDLEALPAKERAARRERGYARMRAAGAHHVADGIGDCPGVIEEINARLRAGEKP
jgi:phosphonoacetaldehyde hydrolase